MSDSRIQGRLRRALHWPTYLLPLLIVMTLVVAYINPYAAVIAGIVDGFFVVFLLWWNFTWRRQTEGELVDFAAGFSEKQRDQLLNLPIPFAVLEETGSMLWVNRAFEALLPADTEEFAIQDMIPKLGNILPDDDTKLVEHITWRLRSYQAELQQVSETAGLYSVFLYDETAHLATLQELDDQRAVVVQVYIDNYEEAMSSAEQVRQSLLAALIERKITKYFAGYDGVVRKLEKDKFTVFMRKKGLMSVMEDRFSLLEDVKRLNIGNSTAVTLSIGVGLDGKSMEEINEFSYDAMNLALARGGDQGIVKTPEYTKYFGGKTQSQERNTRVKARVKAQALRELMQQRDQVLIMGHHLPDMDAFGASVGIYRAARSLGKRAHIVVGEVNASLRPLVNRFLKNPDYPEDMIVGPEKAKTLLDASTMVVVVDVNRPNYTDCPSLLERASSIVVLDHHRQGSEVIKKATLSYIEPYASSASEMVAEVLQYFSDNLKIRPLEAETIYAGIVMDTDNFVAKTGVRTFEAAAFLRRHGADVTRVRKLFRERMADTQARATIISNAEMFEGGFAFGICDAEGVESPTIIGAQAANDLLDIVGVKASIVFTEFNDRIYVSARSIDEVNVQLIMEKLGGGGHLSIAGAQLADCTMEEAIRKVQNVIRQMKKDGEI